MKNNQSIYLKSKNFCTLNCTFLHLTKFFRGIELAIEEIKKAVTALLLAVSALYPGRESNPYSLNGHRILSPACLPVPPPRQELKKLLLLLWVLD